MPGIVFINQTARNGGTTKDGVDCRQTILASNTFAFNVDDDWAFEGNRKSLCIAVEYYDATSRTLTLEYDSVDGNTTKNGGKLYR